MSTTFESLDPFVLSDVYKPDFDFSILERTAYVFDDDEFIGRVPLSENT